MKRITLFIFVSLVMLGMLIPVHGEQYTGVGTGLNKLAQSTMNFLQVGVVPGASALGEAYSAIGIGPAAIFYNPAGLAEMNGTVEGFVATTQWIADINYQVGAIAWNMGNFGVIGVSALFVDYGDIIGTSLLNADNFSTSPLGYTENGMVENVGAYAFGLSLARQINDKFSMGGNVRYVGQQLGQGISAESTEDFETSKLVFDMGVKFNTGFKGFRFGMSLRNFATEVKYQEISAQLPFTFAVGGAVDVMDFIGEEDPENEQLLLAVEFTHPNNYTERVHVGMEYNFMNLMKLRAGYMSNHDVLGLNAGIGLTPEISGKKVFIDYSYSASGEYFDDINRISVGFAF